MTSLGVESDDWHKKNGKEMKRLSNRLRGYTRPNKIAATEKDKMERIEQLSSLQKSTAFVFIIISAAWVTLVMTLSLHTNLQILQSNVVGLAFLVLSTTVVGIQFVTMIFHRFETLLQTIAYIPMSISCTLILKSDEERRAKAKLLGAGRKLSQILTDKLTEKESGLQTLGRTLLGLPERKHSTFQRGKIGNAQTGSYRPAFVKQ